MGEWAGTLSGAAQLLPPIFDDARELSDLPRDSEPWPVHREHSGGNLPAVQASLRAAAEHGAWRWPEQPVVFVSDPHADADGFLRSLVAAGVVRRVGQGVALTPFGRVAKIVIGGDCLDKGPSNLDMLDALRALIDSGADLHLLAGNHDLRLRLALRALTQAPSVLTEHLFVRMGRKIIPLLREVYDRHVTPSDMARVPGEVDCRARMYPSDSWFDAFPAQAAPYLSQAGIAKELRKLREKSGQFAAQAAAAGLTMRMVYAAALRCCDLFLAPGGAYAWFYSAMDVVARSGSLLFVHAGIDDTMCKVLAHGGTQAVNALYRAEAQEHPFAFYTGPVANLVRTKYRPVDKTLTREGVRRLHRDGIKMIVQGHVNNHQGQRLLSKNGLLHLEGDVTLDRASRQSEGLSGIGAGATLIFPSGDVVGLSSDYPKAKHFKPEQHPWEMIA